MDVLHLSTRIEHLQEKIKGKIPLLGGYLGSQEILNDYSRSLHNFSPAPIHKQRQELFKTVIERELKRIFGEDFDFRQFDFGNDSVFSIVDHHDILNHPLFISPNIITNLYRLGENNFDLAKGTTVISDSGIPIDHYGNRRGLSFFGKTLRLYSHAERHKIAFALPKRKDFDLSKQAEKIGLTSEHVQFLKQIEETFNSAAQSETATFYRDQVTIINGILWKKLFEEKLRSNVPDLFHVAGEVITTSLLNKFFHDHSNIFYRVLFEKSIREDVLQSFDGVRGCWKNDKTYGTHFFWGINDRGESERMWVSGDQLVSENGDLQLNLSMESILEALEEEKIYPGLFLVYGIIIFYFGTKPLTGFLSTDYLTRMKEKWISVVAKFDPDEAALIQTIPTSNLVQGPKTIFDFRDGKYVDMYTLDILYKGGVSENYLEKLRSMTLGALLLPGLPDIYKAYIGAENLDVSVDDLMNESFGWIKDY